MSATRVQASTGGTGRKQLFLASSYLEATFLAAAIDAGLYGEPQETDERILLSCSSAVVLELATPLQQAEGIAPLLRRFDRVIDLNEAIDPLHPHTFSPQNGLLPMMQRLLRREWDLGEAELELILESPQVNPAIALARIFDTASLRVYADGLMSYGPTRSRLPLSMLQRIASVDYAPLVPGLTPRLLHEAAPEYRPIPLDAVRAVVSELAAAHDFRIPPAQPRTALVLGQYLSSLELIGPDEETALHERMIAVAAERGMERVVFKPHPAAPPGMLEPLREAAGAAGVDFLVLDSPAIAEIAIAALEPELLLSCFSTALATGATMFGTPAVAVGTGRMLQVLAPYGNSNRVPLSIVDRLWSVDDKPAGPRLQDLVDAIAYCMQAGHLADLEPRVRTTVATATPELLARYFKRRRLAKVGLPVPQGGRRVPDAVRVAARLGRFSAARLAEALQSGARR